MLEEKKVEEGEEREEEEEEEERSIGIGKAPSSPSPVVLLQLPLPSWRAMAGAGGLEDNCCFEMPIARRSARSMAR